MTSMLWILLGLATGCNEQIPFDPLPGVTPPMEMRVHDWEGYWLLGPSSTSGVDADLVAVVSVSVIDPLNWYVRLDGGLTGYESSFSADDPTVTETLQVRTANGVYLGFITTEGENGDVKRHDPPALKYVLRALPQDGRLRVADIDDIYEPALRTLPGRPDGDQWVVGVLTPAQLEELLRPNPNQYLKWSAEPIPATRMAR